MYPTHPTLDARVWQATFGVEGAARAGAAGDGLLLSRTQPRPPGQWHLTLADIQIPMLDAYFAALPPGSAPRVLGSRSVFVADSRDEAWRLAEAGLARMQPRLAAQGHPAATGGVRAWVRRPRTVSRCEPGAMPARWSIMSLGWVLMCRSF